MPKLNIGFIEFTIFTCHTINAVTIKLYFECVL